jgi:hypothetical protein
MKLKTKIEHTFGIEDDLSDLDFSIAIPIKKKTKIIKINKKKKDASTGLF